MTMEMINELINASIRGMLLGVTLFFWGYGLVSISKWFLRAIKRLFLWFFPNSRKKCDCQRQ